MADEPHVGFEIAGRHMEEALPLGEDAF